MHRNLDPPWRRESLPSLLDRVHQRMGTENRRACWNRSKVLFVEPPFCFVCPPYCRLFRRKFTPTASSELAGERTYTTVLLNLSSPHSQLSLWSSHHFSGDPPLEG